MLWTVSAHELMLFFEFQYRKFFKILIITLFNNTRTLKFKAKLTIMFYVERSATYMIDGSIKHILQFDDVS